jgi:hypothetical protein
MWIQGALVAGIVALTLESSATASNALLLKMDHVTICGSDLAVLRKAFTHLGLTPDYGGRHARGGTHMAVLGFEDGSYLELVAPVKAGSVTESDWSKLMLANAGACAWAVASTDIQKDVDALKAAGFPVDGPISGGRKKPDGKVLEWQTAAVGTAQAGAMLPFMIQDRTPREWRVRPSASTAEMKLSGVAAVVLGVRDLDAATSLFRKAYGWPAPVLEEHPEFGAKLASFAGTPVILATPLDGNSWLAKRLNELGESPVAFLLGTREFEKAASNATAAPSPWFGRKIAWFDAEKLQGARLGVISKP